MADPAVTQRATAEVMANRLRLAANYPRDARTLNASDSRTSSFCLFMAAKTTLLAAMASEGVPGTSRQSQHQFGAMADGLPEANPTKAAFKQVEGITAYATTFRYTIPSGRIPAPMSGEDFASHSATLEKLISVCTKWFRVAELDLMPGPPVTISSGPIRAGGATYQALLSGRKTPEIPHNSPFMANRRTRHQARSTPKPRIAAAR